MSFYEYEVIYQGKPLAASDEFIERKLAEALRKVVHELGITANDVKFKEVTEDVLFDGKLGTEIKYAFQQEGEFVQWLIYFFDHNRTYLRFYSEPYFG